MLEKFFCTIRHILKYSKRLVIALIPDKDSVQKLEIYRELIIGKIIWNNHIIESMKTELHYKIVIPHINFMEG